MADGDDADPLLRTERSYGHTATTLGMCPGILNDGLKLQELNSEFCLIATHSSQFADFSQDLEQCRNGPGMHSKTDYRRESISKQQ